MIRSAWTPWFVVAVVGFAAPIAVEAMHALQEPAPPKWEVVSVRRCPPGGGRGAGPAGGPRGARLPVLSPGRMTLTCETVASLVASAFVLYANGVSHPFYATGDSGTRIEGGPSWVRSDTFTITAKAESTPTNAMMQGPMLQAILEDRFRLSLRRETRDREVYALTIARGGSKLRPFKEGTCTPLDTAQRLETAPGAFGLPTLPAGQRWCDSQAFPKGPNLSMIAEGATLEEFANAFLTGVFVDRPVVNRTGLTGRFDIELEFARVLPGDITPPPAGAAAGVLAALPEQLGLRLEPARAPGEVIVIDRVERPSED